MDSPADIIRERLIDLTFGSDAGPEWPITTGLLPDQPDEAISVYDTAGKLDGRIMKTGEQIEHAGIQITVRSPSYASAFTKVKEIALAVDAERHTVVIFDSSRIYLIDDISRTSAILPLGLLEGERQRYHFTINAITTIHKE